MINDDTDCKIAYYYCRTTSCGQTFDLATNTISNKSTKYKIINNLVRLPSSLNTMNLATLSSYNKPVGPFFVYWNQMSDRPIASNQKSYVPSFGCSTKSSITRERPGSQSPGGVGCDIKHNSYNRYLNKLRGKQKHRITPIITNTNLKCLCE
jgi:hypothetical protein